MRVYLPVTLTLLGHVMRSGELPAAPAYAVTAALAETVNGGEATADVEELEYAAFTAAAAAALARLAADPAAPARRVVIAADVPDHQVHATPKGGPAAVTLLEPVLEAEIAAVHADEAVAAPLVAAAVGGDPTSEDKLLDMPLQWWARQEIPDLLSGAEPEPLG